MTSYGGQKRRGNRVIPYVRVSDITGREDTLISDDVQLDQIDRLCEREGLVRVGDPVIDLDLTGRSSKKRKIVPTIRRIENDEADGVVVWKISRWGRNLVDSLLNIRELQAAGGFILSATENLNEVDSAMGKFSLAQMLLIAQLQSDQIGETWANIREYRLRQGKPSTGGPRWGYVWDQENDGYTVDEAVAPAVKRAYEKFAGGLPMTQVVEMLKNEHINSLSGKAFTAPRLRNTLDTGFAAGLLVKYERNDTGAVLNINTNTYLPGAHEPIISEDLWERYLRRRKELRPPRHKMPASRVGSLLVCAHCDAKMSLTHAGRKKADGTHYRYFRCIHAMRHRGQDEDLCTPTNQISDRMVNEAVRKWLQERAKGTSDVNLRAARALAARDSEAETKRLKKDLENLKKRQLRLSDLLLDEVIDADAYKAQNEKMTATIHDLRARLDDAKSNVEVNQIPEHTAFTAVSAAWDVLSEASLNAALRKVISEIVVRRHSDPGPRIRIYGRWEQRRHLKSVA